jgi:Novel STAND NTPase 1
VAGQSTGGGEAPVDARGAMGVQVGQGNTQIIYNYSRLTWTDGVAPPPLISVSGAVESPYRGLGAFDEPDAAFFFGREDAAAAVLERMSRQLDGSGLLIVSGVSGAGSRRCCAPVCCRGCVVPGWPACPKPPTGRVWCSPRPALRLTNLPWRWPPSRGWTPRAYESAWTLIRLGSRSPRVRRPRPPPEAV